MQPGLILFLLLSLAAALAATGDAAPQLRAGQEFYAHGKHDEAIREFRDAVRVEPHNSMAHLWLARALGRKAEKSSRLRAAFMVGDIRREFERSVDLDPGNLEARSDLLDFYLEAPSVFGGGVEKARKQAEAIMRLHKAEGHSAWARIAVKEKRYDEAERHYRAAIEADPKHPGYRRDLAEFLKKHQPLSPKSKAQSPGDTG